jgi:hypothetical protein
MVLGTIERYTISWDPEGLHIPGDGDEAPLFPHVVYLSGPDGEDFGDVFEFQGRANLDRFVETLRLVLPLDVVDCRTR